MNKSELIEAVAKQAEVDAKTAGAVLGAFEDVVTATVKGGKDKVAWTGFLSFERVDKKKTTARNPATGATVNVPAKKVPKVTVGASFKKIVNGDAPVAKLKK